MENQQLFGIKTIYINGFTVHTLCVRVKDNYFNSQLIQKECKGLSVCNVSTKKNSLIEMRFTTMDLRLFNLACKTLGNILKQIAKENLNNKYNWTLNL
jgi:hypothetical protein